MLNEQTVLDILKAKQAANDDRIYELVNNLNILDGCKADLYAQLVDAESLDDLTVRTLYNSSLIFGTTGLRV